MMKRELVVDVSISETRTLSFWEQCRAQDMLTLIPRKVAGSTDYGGTGNGDAEPEKAKECEELHLRVDSKAPEVGVLVLGALQVKTRAQPYVSGIPSCC